MSRSLQEKYIPSQTSHLWYDFWRNKASNANHRAKKKGYDGTLTVDGVIEVARQCNWVCACCGSNEYIVLDHKTPLGLGGLNTHENIQLLCDDCNSLKGRNSDEDLKKLRAITPRREVKRLTR